MDFLSIKSKLKENKGFTLVEVVMGIAIATLIFVSTFNALMSMGNVNKKANLKREINSQIVNIAEEIKDSMPSLSDENAPPYQRSDALYAANTYQAGQGFSSFVHKSGNLYEYDVKTIKAKETQTKYIIILDMSNSNTIRLLFEERIYNLKEDKTPEDTFYPLPSQIEVLVWKVS